MEFCEDLVQTLFSWLPAKSIYRSKATCKSFSKLFSGAEKFFASNQAQHFRFKDDSGFFINNPSKKTEFHSLPGEHLSSGIPPQSLLFLQQAGKILASTNGLLVCQNSSNNELFLCNPSTQTLQTIPTPERLELGDVKVVALECKDPSFNTKEDDYILLSYTLGEEFCDPYKCIMYSPTEGVWKEIGKLNPGSRNLKLDAPAVFHNGALHYISDCSNYIAKGTKYYRPYIVAHDISEGTSRMLRVPKEARRGSHDHSCEMSIHNWGSRKSSSQSICLVRLRKPVFTAWVLTDYQKTSWVRIMKIRVRAMGVNEPHIVGFTVMNGSSLVFATEHKLYKYDLISKRNQQVEEVCEYQCPSTTKGVGKKDQQVEEVSECSALGGICFYSYCSTIRPLGMSASPVPEL